MMMVVPKIKRNKGTLKRVKFLHLLALALFIYSLQLLALKTQLLLKSSSRRSFFFIQVADPQVGVKNGYGSDFKKALNWSEEIMLFEFALSHIARLKPSFLVITGDMQNYFPRNQPGSNGILANYTHNIGMMQVLDLKAALNRIIPVSIPVRVMPGNHDIDNIPDVASMDYYNHSWGNDHYSFWQNEIFFIVLNSQLYYDDGSLFAAKTKQTSWLQSELDVVQSKAPKNIVILTHIPPFGGSLDERHGWGNWQKSDRFSILDMVSSFEYRPTLWLCGHLHANGRYYGHTVNGISPQSSKIAEIVITNSVTSPMQWDGRPANEIYPSAKLTEIVSNPNGADVWEKYIIPDESTRLSGGIDKAGLRVVEFFHDGSYRHKWFSLSDISKIKTINDNAMADGATEIAASW